MVTETRGRPAPKTAHAAPAWRLRRWVVEGAERYTLLALVGVVVVIFSLDSATSGTFLTVNNIRTVLGNEVVVAVAALAAIVPLIAGQFDVSIGPLAGMSSIIAASAMSHGWPLVPAMLVAVATCAVIGGINGALVAYAGVNSFITTLAAGTLVTGLVSLYTSDNVIIGGISQNLISFGSGNFLGVPWVVWIVIAIALSLAFVLGWTVYGRQLASIGASEAAARLVGIRVRGVVASSFVASAALAGIAGVLLLARTGSGNPQIGSGYTLDALSAAFLGATAFSPGRFNVPGTLTGVVFVALCVNGLTLAGASDWADPVFTGAALMIAVALSTTLGRIRANSTNTVSHQESVREKEHE